MAPYTWRTYRRRAVIQRDFTLTVAKGFAPRQANSPSIFLNWSF